MVLVALDVFLERKVINFPDLAPPRRIATSHQELQSLSEARSPTLSRPAARQAGDSMPWLRCGGLGFCLFGLACCLLALQFNFNSEKSENPILMYACGCLSQS